MTCQRSSTPWAAVWSRASQTAQGTGVSSAIILLESTQPLLWGTRESDTSRFNSRAWWCAASSAATCRNVTAAQPRRAIHATPLTSPSRFNKWKQYSLGTGEGEDKTLTFYGAIDFWLLMRKGRQSSHKAVKEPSVVKPHGLRKWGLFIVTLRGLVLRGSFERPLTPLKEVSSTWPECKRTNFTSVSLFFSCSWTEACFLSSVKIHLQLQWDYSDPDSSCSLPTKVFCQHFRALR